MCKDDMKNFLFLLKSFVSNTIRFTNYEKIHFLAVREPFFIRI